MMIVALLYALYSPYYRLSLATGSNYFGEWVATKQESGAEKPQHRFIVSEPLHLRTQNSG